MEKPSRRLEIKITEVIDGDLTDEESMNLAYRGAFRLPTRLNVKYVRKTKGEGEKYVEPLDPVYLDSISEALAYVMSLTVHNAQDVPLLAAMMIGRVASRFQTYALSKFPGLVSVMQTQAGELLSGKKTISERRYAYAEYISAQLRGIEDPCAECVDSCEFNGEFNKKEEK